MCSSALALLKSTLHAFWLLCRCRFDCGSGVGRARTDNSLLLGRWNVIHIRQHRRTGWIQLNDGPRSFAKSKVRAIELPGGHFPCTVFCPMSCCFCPELYRTTFTIKDVFCWPRNLRVQPLIPIRSQTNKQTKLTIFILYAVYKDLLFCHVNTTGSSPIEFFSIKNRSDFCRSTSLRSLELSFARTMWPNVSLSRPTVLLNFVDFITIL